MYKLWRYDALNIWITQSLQRLGYRLDDRGLIPGRGRDFFS